MAPQPRSEVIRCLQPEGPTPAVQRRDRRTWRLCPRERRQHRLVGSRRRRAADRVRRRDGERRVHRPHRRRQAPHHDGRSHRRLSALLRRCKPRAAGPDRTLISADRAACSVFLTSDKDDLWSKRDRIRHSIGIAVLHFQDDWPALEALLRDRCSSRQPTRRLCRSATGRCGCLTPPPYGERGEGDLPSIHLHASPLRKRRDPSFCLPSRPLP